MKKALYLLGVSSLLLSSPLVSAEPALAEKQTSLKKYEPKNYDHLLGKIDGLNDDLLKMHFKLYQGYVNNANTLLQKIQELNDSGKNRTPEFAGYKHMLGWEFDGMLLHEYYFDNLGGTQKTLDSNDPLRAKIAADFGSYDNWKSDFVATGLIRGIGWVVSYIDPKSGRLINVWINEHDVGHLAGATPILIMDVFEHAYITQYGIDRAKYIDVFFNNINWDAVSKRYSKESKKIISPN